ncbi:unnamed protein product [Brassica oleracea var. botrytis]
MLTLRLQSGESVCVSLFDHMALAFHTKFDSYGKEPRIVLATGVNPKIVGGKRVFVIWGLLIKLLCARRLFLNATSATHLYFDSETDAGKEFFDK